MENLKIDSIGSSEGVREILGFLHHRISQQEKDIALLNRRVAELIQNFKSSEQSTVQAFMEASNCRLDSFSASIQSLTDQMIKFTLPNQLNIISKSKENYNELKNETKEEIDKIKKEIESLKNQIIYLNSNQNEQENPKQKAHKKSKIKKNKLVSVSIFDSKPQNSDKSIDTLTNEINQLKKKIINQNEITNQKYESANRRIDELEEKLESIQNKPLQFNEDTQKVQQNHTKNEVDFLPNKEKDEKVLSIDLHHQNSPILKSTDSIESFQISDVDFQNQINRKSSLNNINYNYDDSNDNDRISKHKSFASTTKLNSPNKKSSQVKMNQNATPRKTATHYTLINGDYLKRPGSQMIQKRNPYKSPQQKYPL